MKKKLAAFVVSFLMIFVAAAALSQAPASAGANPSSLCGHMGATELASYSHHSGAIIIDPAVKYVWAGRHAAAWSGGAITAVYLTMQIGDIVTTRWVNTSPGWFFTWKDQIYDITLCGYASGPVG